MEMKNIHRAKKVFIATNVIGSSKIFSISFVENVEIQKIYDFYKFNSLVQDNFILIILISKSFLIKTLYFQFKILIFPYSNIF